MDVYFLIGAILGSGFFIVAGRAPAERLVQAVQTLYQRRKR